MSVVGVDYGKVEVIISELAQEIKDLGETIEEVDSVSKSIETTFGGQAGTAFQNTMADYVTKANQAIPVLTSIKDWVNQTAEAYKEYDGQIAGKFTLS